MGRNLNARLIIVDSLLPCSYDASQSNGGAAEWPLPITDMLSLAHAGGGLRSHAQWLISLAKSNYRLVNMTTPLPDYNLHIIEAVPIVSSAPLV
jgi:hypothetical protein